MLCADDGMDAWIPGKDLEGREATGTQWIVVITSKLVSLQVWLSLLEGLAQY